MKNKLNLILCLSAILIFVSCKKNYTCTCQSYTNLNSGVGEAVVKAKNIEEAELECNALSTYTTNTIPQTYDTYCTLK